MSLIPDDVLDKIDEQITSMLDFLKEQREKDKEKSKLLWEEVERVLERSKIFEEKKDG